MSKLMLNCTFKDPEPNSIRQACIHHDTVLIGALLTLVVQPTRKRV